MTTAVRIVLVLFCLGGTMCSIASEGGSSNTHVVASIRLMLTANQVSQAAIEATFCHKLVQKQSGRFGYIGYSSNQNDCVLPVTSIQLDVPSSGEGADTFVTIWLDRKSCMQRKFFEREFSGGSSSISVDSGSPIYNSKVGADIVGARYETLASRYNCVSEIYLRIKSNQLNYRPKK